VYEEPADQPQRLEQAGTLRAEIRVYADNFKSKEPYVLAIKWTGKWPFPEEEIEKHLQIQEIQEGSAAQTCSAP
jgi:hypothetical protein